MRPVLNSIKEGRKIIFSFLAVFLLVVIVGIVGIQAINRMRQDFREMYQYEMVPAIDMTHVLEHYYQNRFHLEEHLSGISNETYKDLEQEIQQNNHYIDSVLIHYHNLTLGLPRNEQEIIRECHNNFEKYRNLESKILRYSRSEQKDRAMELFTKESYASYKQTIKPLVQLSNSQLRHSKTLYNDAQQIGQNMKIFLYGALGFAILLAISLAILVSRAIIEK